MKSCLRFKLAVLLGFVGSIVWAQHPGAGTRVDYLNEEGERVESYSLEPQSYSFILFNVMKDYDNKDWTIEFRGQSIKTMKFIPWGVESYPMTVETEPGEEIKVTEEIIDGTTTRGTDDLLCGSKVRFTIEVPDGAYPSVSILNEYTGLYNGEPHWSTSRSLGLYALLDPVSNRTILNMDYRKNLLARLGGNGLFTRVEGKPNVWYFDLTMPNEPISLKFGCEKPDTALLNALRLFTLQYLYTQIRDVSISPGNSGEPFIMSWVGDYLSDDLISALFTRWGISAFDYTDPNKTFTNLPWVNYYILISAANLLIDQLDRFDVPDMDKEIARAQMQTLRSHAYCRLLQIYGDRWQNSNDGTSLCVPLETTFNTENLPLASMKEIADFCYAELNEAIAVFSKYNYVRNEIIEPDLEVARGVLMRIALLKEDWQTAATMAESILANVPLTTNDQYKSGFFTPEQSWIWGAWNNASVQDYWSSMVYYWSNLTYDACNGRYCDSWRIGTNAISRDLYDCTKAKDIRRSLYVMPDHFKDDMSHIEWWYNDDNFMRGAGIWIKNYMATPIYEYYENNKPEGVIRPAFTDIMVPSGQIYIPFGGHTKFYQPGDNQFVDAAMAFMRSDEVLLTLAEAYYRLGNEGKAREWLFKLNSMRIEGYNLDLSGEELLKEIQLTRKIELWGEGHSWFDMKRWNLPVIRRQWIAGDANSGNWPGNLAGMIEPDANNGWKFAIPILAIQNNPLLPSETRSQIEEASVIGQSVFSQGSEVDIETEMEFSELNE